MSSGLLRNYGIQDANAYQLQDGLSDPINQPMFETDVTSALNPSFKFTDNDGYYEIAIGQTDHITGLVNADGQTVTTTVWGYGGGASGENITWPGRTIEVQSDEAIKIEWKNKLANNEGPLPHLLPVDESIHWCYGLPGYENVTIENDGVPIVTHVHGAHVDSDSDGNPEYFFGTTIQSRGPRWTSPIYKYDNSQPAGTLWYHDHALGITRLNVYTGLAGFYIIRDALDTGEYNNPLTLPANEYEQAYVIQDRMFKKNGELFFPAYYNDYGYSDFITPETNIKLAGAPTILAEFFGDHIVVNGKIWPRKEVEPRHYRLRFLNGCDSRFMRLRFRYVALDDTDLTNASDPLLFDLIGTDQGLFASPIVELTEINFAPAERLDIVFNFAQAPGKRIIVENLLGDGPFTGDLPDLDPANGEVFPDRRTDRIMAFDVATNLSSQEDLYDSASVISNYTPNSTPDNESTIRMLALFEGEDEYNRLQPMLGTVEDGALHWDNAITENPELNSTEIWEIYNYTADAHPIHVHLVHFDILKRSYIDNDNDIPPLLSSEEGPKDIVIAYPGQVTRIKMTFDKSGRYVWHCHILSHEDHDMMRPFHVGPI